MTASRQRSAIRSIKQTGQPALMPGLQRQILDESAVSAETVNDQAARLIQLKVVKVLHRNDRVVPGRDNGVRRL